MAIGCREDGEELDGGKTVDKDVAEVGNGGRGGRACDRFPDRKFREPFR
jgi:hypothetical protein